MPPSHPSLNSLWHSFSYCWVEILLVPSPNILLAKTSTSSLSSSSIDHSGSSLICGHFPFRCHTHTVTSVVYLLSSPTFLVVSFNLTHRYPFLSWCIWILHSSILSLSILALYPTNSQRRISPTLWTTKILSALVCLSLSPSLSPLCSPIPISNYRHVSIYVCIICM